MKKFKIFSLVLLVVMLTCAFSGCTNANSATVLSIKTMFGEEVKQYLTTDEKTNSAIIKTNVNGYKFIFEPNDNSALMDRISRNEANNLYSNLSNEGNYYELMSHASKYFFSKFMSNSIDVYQSSYNKIKQEKLTELYNQVQNVIEEIKLFGKEYRNLSADYVVGNTNSQGTRVSLNNLLNQYKNLIGAVLEMNLATLDVYDNSLLTYADLTEENAKVPVIELDRMVDAFELYVTEYLYQRYMVYGSQVDMTTLTSNSLLVAMNQLVGKSRTSRQNSNRSAISDILTYTYLRTVEQSMKQTIELNRHSAQVLKKGLPESTADDYSYKKSIYDEFTNYESTLLGYLQLINYLIDMPEAENVIIAVENAQTQAQLEEVYNAYYQANSSAEGFVEKEQTFLCQDAELTANSVMYHFDSTAWVKVEEPVVPTNYQVAIAQEYNGYHVYKAVEIPAEEPEAE